MKTPKTVSVRSTMRAVAAILLPLTLACGRTHVDQDGRPVERFEFASYAEVAPLFERFGYTTEAWQEGVREVPRIYLTRIPPRWRNHTASGITVLAKKRIFFRTLAPLALRANELILRVRARLVALAENLAGGRELAAGDRQWLGETAVRYRLLGDAEALPAGEGLADLVDALLVRVDMVPVSLVLAQGAEESGWGTSRFAAEGNALFGQWTWNGEGIKPEGQRTELGDHRVASFETPLLAIMAYMHNLNSHGAYEEFRAARAAMRRTGERLRGWDLARSLTSYSERGAEYVETLHTIMRVNRLEPADEAYLGDTPTIYLVPVGEGSG